MNKVNEILEDSVSIKLEIARANDASANYELLLPMMEIHNASCQLAVSDANVLKDGIIYADMISVLRGVPLLTMLEVDYKELVHKVGLLLAGYVVNSERIHLNEIKHLQIAIGLNNQMTVMPHNEHPAIVVMHVKSAIREEEKAHNGDCICHKCRLNRMMDSVLNVDDNTEVVH